MQDKNGRTSAAKRNMVPVEKKMALAQHIRRENQDNRVKLWQREKILYGGAVEPPLFSNGKYGQGVMEEQRAENGMYADNHGAAPVYTAGTFRYRMVIAVLLFVGFLVCDTNGNKIGTYSMNDIHDMIVADSFHLYGGEGVGADGEAARGLAQLLDFGK